MNVYNQNGESQPLSAVPGEAVHVSYQTYPSQSQQEMYKPIISYENSNNNVPRPPQYNPNYQSYQPPQPPMKPQNPVYHPPRPQMQPQNPVIVVGTMQPGKVVPHNNRNNLMMNNAIHFDQYPVRAACYQCNMVCISCLYIYICRFQNQYI